MPRGKLEVILVRAKGLEDSDFLSKVDPYCILTCGTQEQKSSVISGDQSPEWNETFIFNIVSGTASSELSIKIYDKDTFSSDDYLGEARIPLEAVLCEGNLPTTSYNVVKDGAFRGEVRLNLSFTPEEGYNSEYESTEEYGGWKDSSM